MFKKILSLVLAALLLVGTVATLASCGEEEETAESKALLPVAVVSADFKIGLICLHDKQSTYDANFINALERVKATAGLTDDQVIIKTGIPEGNECYTAAKELAEAGCKVIFADSFGHESYLLKAAKEYPDVEFCHATGTTAHTENLPNFHNAFASIYEGRYLAGIVAGMKLNELKSQGKLKGSVPTMGYVGAFTYAEVISGYTSFYLGAKSVCPDVVMKVQFTGSWYDEKGEKAAAEALMSAGCDLISQHADSMGAPTACEDAGIPNVSYNGSTYEAGPTTFLISSAINWSPYFLYIISQASNNQPIVADYVGTISTGSVVLSGINNDAVAARTKEAVEAAIAQFRAGTLKVFNTESFTVDGQKLSSYMADVDTDAAYAKDTEVIVTDENGTYFAESKFRSAPYFDIQIDGIELLNVNFG